MSDDDAIVDAIRDLGRIMIALSDKVESKSDAIRKLDAVSIPPSRIASYLAINLRDVTSMISKERKKATKKPTKASKGRR